MDLDFSQGSEVRVKVQVTRGALLTSLLLNWLAGWAVVVLWIVLHGFIE